MQPRKALGQGQAIKAVIGADYGLVDTFPGTKDFDYWFCNKYGCGFLDLYK
jgi:hypothetical protein